MNTFECPNCGAVIQVDDQSPLRVECPNCYEKVVNPYAREKVGSEDFINSDGNDGNYVDGIAVTLFDRNGVRETLASALAERVGIYSGFNIGNIKKVCIPYHVINVSYQAPWKAVFEWMEMANTQIQSFQKKTEEGNGMASGELTHISRVCATTEIPYKLLAISESLAQVPREVIPYHSDGDSYDTVVIQPKVPFKQTWERIIAPELQERGKRDAEQQANSNISTSFMESLRANRIKPKVQKLDFQVNYTINSCQTILVPFWTVDYSYEGTSYSAVVGGDGKILFLETPQGRTEQAYTETRGKQETRETWEDPKAQVKSETKSETSSATNPGTDEAAKMAKKISNINKSIIFFIAMGILAFLGSKRPSHLLMCLCIAGGLYIKKKYMERKASKGQ